MITRLVIATLVLCASLFGQTPPSTDSLNTVSIRTDPPGADLFIDSMYVGKSPVNQSGIQQGVHRIRAFAPSVFSWNATVVEDTLQIVSGQHVEKRLVLARTYNVQTEPAGGTVLLNDKPVGVTPLYFIGSSELAGNLTIRKRGYDSLVVPFNEFKERSVRLRLRPIDLSSNPPMNGDLRGPDLVATDHWPTYVSGITMIVSGVTSAILKDKANREFDSYLLTKNPATLSNTNRLDRGAAISLVVSQISFVVLSYLLLSE
jgi:hypothetical protein